MKIEELREQLTLSLPGLFQCDDFGNDRFRVRTPLLFPNGDVIDVFIAKTADSFTVTDYGDAADWLDTRTTIRRRSPKQRGLIEDTCETLGIGLENEQMVLREVAWSNLVDSVVRIAQAEARIGDVWFTTRQATKDVSLPRMVTDATVNEVDRWLRNRKLNVQSNVEETGTSRRTWFVDFKARSRTKESLVFVLSATGKQSAQNRLYEVAAACLDIGRRRQESGQLRFISLFDDTNDTWSPEDYELLRLESDVAHWSKPDELEKLLEVHT